MDNQIKKGMFGAVVLATIINLVIIWYILKHQKTKNVLPIDSSTKILILDNEQLINTEYNLTPGYDVLIYGGKHYDTFFSLTIDEKNLNSSKKLTVINNSFNFIDIKFASNTGGVYFIGEDRFRERESYILGPGCMAEILFDTNTKKYVFYEIATKNI